MGPCATCGALCCPDCVELELGWTTRRAVCHACLNERPSPPPRPGRSLWIAAALSAIAIGAWFLLRP